MAGLIGYFQVDSGGRLSTPAVPERGSNYAEYGVSEQEYRARLSLAKRLRDILNTSPGENLALEENETARRRLAAATTKDVVSIDATRAERDDRIAQHNVFDRLSSALSSSALQKRPGDYPRSIDLKHDARLETKIREQSDVENTAAAFSRRIVKRKSRKEQVALVEISEQVAVGLAAQFTPADAELVDAAPAMTVSPPTVSDAAAPKQSSEIRVRFFESEIDPFVFELLDDEHFVLFRNVWRSGERFIQGAIIIKAVFIDQVVERAYRETSLSDVSDLLVAYEGEVMSVYHSGPGAREYLPRAQQLRGELLYRSRLSAPTSALELIYTLTELPFGPGAKYLAWVTLVLGLALSGGCYVIYRYGVAQITVYRQQQDFVSAVTHELKTPLTSIRMYSEILKSGWASEEKKATYYNYIHDESERLSRLIANVLQLSRMTRGNHAIETARLTMGELLDVSRAKIASQLERAAFVLEVKFEPQALTTTILADGDAFTQIMINLIDNAIKFSPADALKQVDLGCTRQADGAICVTVRDYGEGIPKDQRRRIFELFYRPESELTRDSVGTGIGLALVHQLVGAMKGQIEVRNCDPGVEFTMTFPNAEE